MLLSERSLHPSPHNPTRGLPDDRLIRSVAIRAKAPRNPEDGARASSPRVAAHRAKLKANQPAAPSVDPLYIFMCALSWREQSNTGAGWELVGCLRSAGLTAQLAAALLAQADPQRPVRALQPAIDGPRKATPPRERGLPSPARWGQR